jgi:hypothetical protein
MKKVLFAAFAGLCVASSIMGTTSTKGRIRTNQGMVRNALDTVPKPDSPKFALFVDTIPKKPDSPKFVRVVNFSMDTVPKKTDSPKFVRVINFAMDTVPKKPDSPKLAQMLAMK